MCICLCISLYPGLFVFICRTLLLPKRTAGGAGCKSVFRLPYHICAIMRKSHLGRSGGELEPDLTIL